MVVMITFHHCYGYNKVMYCCYLTQDWPEVPTDFDEWSPQERNGDWENYNYHGVNEVSDIFMNMFT